MQIPANRHRSVRGGERVTLEERVAQLEKEVAGLKGQVLAQPEFVPCHGFGVKDFEISNPTDPGIANPE